EDVTHARTPAALVFSCRLGGEVVFGVGAHEAGCSDWPSPRTGGGRRPPAGGLPAGSPSSLIGVPEGLTPGAIRAPDLTVTRMSERAPGACKRHPGTAAPGCRAGPERPALIRPTPAPPGAGRSRNR